jgi:hypothetical protein
MFSYTVAKEMLGMSRRTNRELTLKSVSFQTIHSPGTSISLVHRDET